MRPIWTLISLCVATTVAARHGLRHHVASLMPRQSSDAAEKEKAKEGMKLLASIPDCGLGCLKTVIASSPCSPLDHACTCGNKTIAAEVQVCVLASCTISEALSTKNITATICERPVRDRGSTVAGTAIGGLVFALIAYMIRVMSKLHMRWGSAVFFSDLWWDDFVITLAIAVDLPFMILSVRCKHRKAGQDIWTIKQSHLTPILKILYFNELFYIFGLVFVKVAILLTYLRFFSDVKFRKVVFVVIALNLINLIGFVFALMFQCTPVDYAWLRWDGTHKGTCVEFDKIAWPAAAINIVLDLMVIGLPFPQLWKMKMNKRKKLQVMIMFGTGLIITVLSILRLQSLVAYTDHNNFTWVFVTTGAWSKLELNAAILCACMPAIRNYIRRFSPATTGDTVKGGNTTAKSGLSGRESPWLASLDRRVHQRTMNDDSDDIRSGTLTVSDFGKSVDTENFVELKEQGKDAKRYPQGTRGTVSTTETQQSDY
ncbi:Satratoxin biosynthesis SC1 cluster protein 4 [Pseudocercospora fuligena]|uniref:Satratoxin biosynthesis SC1 cluster protein 4 n=1 Tax=Pseudocercospora fuligena TaxID=685502 RepID=A0A8H6RAC3_9PEZI|nr:Satratoxin biosynthesis SC1 cluster protein 4 [Pseudocercospora fuligena]